MVGNKAQKAVAAALTGVLAFGGVAPAFAGVWTGTAHESWYRVDGSHEATYQLGTFDIDDDGFSTAESAKSGPSGTEIVKGENRLDTMFDAINYNADLYNGTNVVVLASGWSQADSLVATGVAGMLQNNKYSKLGIAAAGGDVEEVAELTKAQIIADLKEQGKDIAEVPVILTAGNTLSLQAKRAITWLAENRTAEKAKDFKVYIVGGTAAVSEDVADAVADIKVEQTVDGKTEKKAISVERLAGDNRMETSLEAAKVIDDDGWLDDDLADSKNFAYVANGWAPADALSVSSSAYYYGEPVLLTDTDGKLTEEQVDYLKKLDNHVGIAVIGGPAQPSAQQLWDAGVSRAAVDYLAGTNRYETSAAVIEWGADRGSAWNAIAVASGANAHMADALIGGAFVGANGGVLALVDGIDQVVALREAYDKVNVDLNKTDDKHADAPDYAAYIIGGESAVDKKFADKLNDNFPVQES